MHIDFGILVEQPYIEGDKVSENERMAFMYEMGFSDAGMDFDMHLNYQTDYIYVGDLNEYNLLKHMNGSIHVFDADCRLNTPTLGFRGKWEIPHPHIDFSRSNFWCR